MKKQCICLASAVTMCLSLNAFAKDLTSLHFEQGLLKTQAKSGALIGYLSKEGRRLTPDSCKVTLGQEMATAQTAASGCIVNFDGQGYAQVQAQVGEERATFVVLSTKTPGYTFEHAHYNLVRGQQLINQLFYNGALSKPATCEAINGDAGITASVDDGCFFQAGSNDASDIVIAKDTEGNALDGFSVSVGTGGDGGYVFEEAEQSIDIAELKDNLLTFNGIATKPDACVAEDSDVVAVGAIENGCRVQGVQEGTTTVTAYQIGGVSLNAVSEYRVNVSGDRFIVDSDYDGVRDEYDSTELINDSMKASEAYGLEKWANEITGQGSSDLVAVSDRYKFYDKTTKTVHFCVASKYFDGSHGFCVPVTGNSPGYDYDWDLQTKYIDMLTPEMKEHIQVHAGEN